MSFHFWQPYEKFIIKLMFYLIKDMKGLIKEVKSSKNWYIQLGKMNMGHLINKQYVKEVTLTEQNLC